MIGQRRAREEYGLTLDDLAMIPCRHDLYNLADVQRLSQFPACQGRLAEAKRKEEERQLAIREELRQEREEAEKNEQECWQPLRNGRTPEQLYDDPWPEALTTLCRDAVIAEHRKQFDERDHDFVEIQCGHGNEIERIERGADDHEAAFFCDWEWFDHLTGDRKPLFCYPGWNFVTFRDSIREEVSELLDHYVFGGVADEDERYEARETYCIDCGLDDFIDGLLCATVPS